MFNNQIIAGAAGQGGSFYSHSLDQSLRFDDGSSDHLTFTPSSAGNQKTWTWSAWIKRGTLGTKQNLFNPTRGGDATNESQMDFTANDQFQIYDSGATRGNKVTTRKFRDPSAWYHIVVALDINNATAADRIKIYVNGEREESFATNVNPGTSNWGWNAAHEHSIGSYNYGTDGSFFDGYMAEVHFIDGTALNATSFGETSNGVWIPKEYSGSYGTNGWYLPFAQDTSGSSAFFSDSGNSYVQFSDTSLYDIGSSDDFTIEFFFNPSATAITDYSYLFGNYVSTSGPYMALQADLRSSGKDFNLYYGNGLAYNFGTATDNFVAGQWYHVAVNRVSGNLRFFLDGTQLGSTQTSNTTAWDNNNVRIGQGQSNGSNGFDGYISNVRMVVGSAVYADGASITVPTATLTDVTNTKLLALTTSTITEDASSNNITGAFSGSGYFSSKLSPFSDFDFYNDRSGNTNNWTANNLVTSDVVPDSPTNNFSTWNEIGRMFGTSNVANMSEGSLKATTAGNSSHITSTFGIEPSDTQGYYWEVKAISLDTSRSYLGIIAPEGGAGSASGASYSFYYKGVLNMNGNYYGNNDTSSTNVVSLTSWTTNDILMFAYKDGKFWIGKNGTWMNSGDPAAGTGDLVAQDGGRPSDRGDVTWFPYAGYNSTYTANFGQDGTFAGTETAGGNSDENGYGDFKYSVPSGFLAMCSANLPEPSIGPNSSTASEKHFNTVLYTGTGSSQSITGVGFQPDWVWIKGRSNARRHMLFDVVRGVQNRLITDDTNDETTMTDGLSSFDSDGFTEGGNLNTGNSSETFVAWNWKAGGTASSIAVDTYSSGVPSIASSVSANTDAGFSIVSWAGNLTSGATVGHGLSEKPELIIVKNRDSAQNWNVWYKNLTSEYVLYPNLTNAQNNSPASFGTHTNQVFGVDNSVESNGSGNDMIAYCFHSVDGFSKVGTYYGNTTGYPNGVFVWTGFRPAFVMTKAYGTNSAWVITDNERNSSFNNDMRRLYANLTSAEGTFNTNTHVEYYSNGFSVHSTTASDNANRINQQAFYVFLAFAEAPFKYANAR